MSGDAKDVADFYVLAFAGAHEVIGNPHVMQHNPIFRCCPFTEVSMVYTLERI